MSNKTKLNTFGVAVIGGANGALQGALSMLLGGAKGEYLSSMAIGATLGAGAAVALDKKCKSYHGCKVDQIVSATCAGTIAGLGVATACAFVSRDLLKEDSIFGGVVEKFQNTVEEVVSEHVDSAVA